MPKKGGERISSLGSETAADIKILAATVLELVERSSNIPATRKNLYNDEEEYHLVKHSLAGTNTVGCKIPEAVESRLNSIDKSLTALMNTLHAPNKSFNLSVARQQTSTTPSYALAASKHAPRPANSNSAPPTTFRPVQARPTPTPPSPSAIKTTNTIMLVQSVKDGKEFGSVNYPTLIATINSKLTEAKIKVNMSDVKTIQIRSVHQHPSNNLVLYTTTPAQADTLRAQAESWIPMLSPNLSLHNPVHTVL